SCQEFFTSVYEYTSVVMTCDGYRGVWKNKLPFSCTEECGIHVPTSKSKEFILSESQNLPWNGFMSELLFPGFSNSVCSAVLIDRAFAITSITCLRSTFSPEKPLWLILSPDRILLTSDETELNEKNDYLVADTFWTPEINSTKDFGLTLIKLDTPATPLEGQGDPAVCFLDFPKYR
ncbi:unnamed protein product, partial [Allacma fusca]